MVEVWTSFLFSLFLNSCSIFLLLMSNLVAAKNSVYFNNKNFFFKNIYTILFVVTNLRFLIYTILFKAFTTLSMLYSFFFFKSVNLWCPLLIIALYHHSKTLISFWCKQRMNLKFYIINFFVSFNIRNYFFFKYVQYFFSCLFCLHNFTWMILAMCQAFALAMCLL